MGANLRLRSVSLLVLAGWSLGNPALAAVAQTDPVLGVDEIPQSLAPPPDPGDQERVDESDVIIVTGSRIPRPNETSDSPVQTARSQDFVITGVPGVEQTLNQLPQLVPGITNTSNNPGTGAATLDLRGLGSVRTLVLVNGRRWIANDAGGVPEVDVNTIPASLIDRVDVVTGGASAVYGSDAVTGVINFVLKNRLRGLHVDATQNLTQRGDGQVSSVDLSYGASFFNDRATLIVSGGRLTQSPVLQSARTLSRVTLTDACVAPGTRGSTGASTPANVPIEDCATPNVLGFVAGGSSAIPGSHILGVFVPVSGSSNLAFLPRGVRFDAGGQAIRFNADTDLFNFAPANYLQVGFRRWSANAFPSFEVSRALTLYGELSFIRTDSPQQLAPVPAFLSPQINLDTPFLSADAARLLDINFGVDAAGNRGFVGSRATGFTINSAFAGDADGLVEVPDLRSRLEGLGPRQVLNRRTARRGLVGARGEIKGDWHYDMFLSSSHVEHESAYQNSGSLTRLLQSLQARRNGSGQIVCIDPSNGCVPANIFGPGNLSEGAADFIRTNPVDVSIIKEKVAELAVRGEVPLLAAGPAGIAAGTTWRQTSYAFVPDASLFTGDDLGFAGGAPAAGSTKVWELFGEARVPLLADRPFARELSAELGIRYSRYDSVGPVWTWKLLGDWSPITGLYFRGGFQRAVRAPNVRELFEQNFTDFGFLLDPCSAQSGLLGSAAVADACIRNGVPAEFLGFTDFETVAPTLYRGNPDTKAEAADTFTIGVRLTPRHIPGFSATIDFYDIRIANAIGRLNGGGPLMVIGCILGAGGDPLAPVCQGFDRDENGFVSFLDQPTANVPYIRARGIDWQFGYQRDLPWGLLGGRDRAIIHLSGTRYLKNGMKPNESLDEIECTGTFLSLACSNTIGGAVPKWKFLNTLTYDSGPMSLTLRHRWFSSTVDARAALTSRFGFTYYVPPEGRLLESRHYFDLAATARIGDRFALTFGVNNLTDAKPALTGNLQVQANTDPSLYDALGRRFFVTLAARIR